MTGWRTLSVQNRCKLSVKSGQLLVTKEDGETVVPTDHINKLIIETGQCSISAAALQMMAENNIPVIICDGKHNPAAEMISVSAIDSRTAKIREQIEWSAEKKAELWETVAKQKIRNQMRALDSVGRTVPDRMFELEQELSGNDFSCREGQAANIYFNEMFGYSFRRHNDDPINAFLNYGYTILMSTVSRTIFAHGFLTEIGVHHCSKTNPFNFSCDIMEPFRPIVDVLAYENGENEFDAEQRRLLCGLPGMQVRYSDRSMKLQDAIEQYFLDCVETLRIDGKHRIGEIVLNG